MCPLTSKQATELMEVIALSADPETQLSFSSDENTFESQVNGLSWNIKDVKEKFLLGDSAEQRGRFRKSWNDFRSRTIKEAVSSIPMPTPIHIPIHTNVKGGAATNTGAMPTALVNRDW
ncbi:hypothetical protein FRB94_014386 [Tulasnella sp. JGI-2019a]|nr:hypothetical protein FRB94_014386 [Tulasnella sp. JGI-2019a]KAG9008628.1 hypothetical protein FRB93_006547 [Tulasnella sp. JGI-2019a]